jgi:hypothetical protein
VRLVQGDSQRDAILRKDRMTRFQYNFSLLSALLDHWRPETHTYHFTVGEMTVTLQDTSLLMMTPSRRQSIGSSRRTCCGRLGSCCSAVRRVTRWRVT